MNNTNKWWSEEYGFFGDYYMRGDNSVEGYLANQNLSLAERTRIEVDGIVRLLDLEGGERILDIPCGYGRHSIGLVQRGFNVTAVDLNSVHLDQAKANAQNEEVKPMFVQENMLDIRYKEEFDAVLNMFYSFGFFETDEENMQVLKNFFEALRPGGKFLFHTDVNVPRILARKDGGREDGVKHLTAGGTLRVTDRYDPQSKRMYGSWTIEDEEGKKNQKDYSVRVYTEDEFIGMCRAVGFTKFASYSDWDKSPYSLSSEYMIVVAEK